MTTRDHDHGEEDVQPTARAHWYFTDVAVITPSTLMMKGHHRQGVGFRLPSTRPTWLNYTRARAEALGFSCKVGLLTRLERIGLIAILSAVGLPLVMIWALAVLSVFTVIQRILYVYAVSMWEEQDDPAQAQ